MSVIESLRTAASSMGANKMRALLTMLGIVIGVASVVALLSLGEGVEASITGEIEGLGSNLLYVTPSQADGATTPSYLTVEDSEAMADRFNVPALAAVAPAMQGQLRVERGETAGDLTVSGTNNRFVDVRSLDLAMGGFLTEADVQDEARVAVLGWGAYTDLFEEGEYPIAQTVTVDGVRMEVVGVLEEQGGFGVEDYTVYVPLTTAQARFFPQRTLSGERPIATVYASVVDETQIDAAIAQIGDLLRERHKLSAGDEDDFRITSQQAILDLASQITGILTLFLGAIAGISLLVGGIGIMNIMLVSVTERTREIGIRKAVGATRRDILLQFLLEAIVLSVTGGLLGILLGVVGGTLISSLMPDLQAVSTPDTLAMAAGVSSAVGLLFGTYPAMRAARLHPIEALRYE
ncbi:MAG TPA: ABC transporter permease [Anaerolineae bacterium]|nr:ABC transporter permease [Anaerolineae bacterium]